MNQKAPLFPAERRERILDILREEYTVRGSRLSEMLNVSEMTIRRDLDALEKEGLVERTHGGAVFRQERVIGKFRYQSSVKENPHEKEIIARRAAEMIEPHETVFIGEGTTAAQVVRFAPRDMPFTVATNNLGVVSEIRNGNIELLMLGGIYDAATHSLAGPLTMEMIGRINAAKVFLGADGLSLRAGLTTPNLEIAVLERQMIRYTHGQVIVMVDHTKFGLVAEMAVAPLNRVDVLITNRKVPEHFKEDLAKMGLEVVVAREAAGNTHH